MSARARRVAFGVATALAVGLVSFWPVARDASQPTVSEPEPARMQVTLAAVAAPQRVTFVQPAAAPVADSSDQHPHPLTPEREALQQELRLVGALQDALDLQDVPALRALVARYRAHVPGDENKLGEGYARLADCLESDAQDQPAVRAAAAAYYENERASTLRRYIRRYCLER